MLLTRSIGIVIRRISRQRHNWREEWTRRKNWVIDYYVRRGATRSLSPLSVQIQEDSLAHGGNDKNANLS